MFNLNTFQYFKSGKFDILNKYSISALERNEFYDDLCLQYYKKYQYKSFKTFAFSKEGFLGLLLELKGKIAICVGETQALIDGAWMYESLGFEIHWVGLNNDGTVNLYDLQDQDIDYLFLSTYVMDTFLKIDLEKIHRYTKAKIISNGTSNISKKSYAIYFDNYKLNGFHLSGVMLFEDCFELLSIGQIDTLALKVCFDSLEKKSLEENDTKAILIEELTQKFADDICFFVDNTHTLENTVHFGLKEIKARELIRTMALSNIFMSNGEGCSLGLSKPSRILQEMGYDEKTSRTSLSLSFNSKFSKDQIDKFVNILYLKYKQIKMLQKSND
jgi:hypothetical protein